jgi:hypothetical protein
MASISNRTLFVLLFIFLITNSIHGYRLHQSSVEEDDYDDLTSNQKINLRSVLWPKICFTTLIKKNAQEDQQNDYNKPRSTRNTRRCYPFDTV